jgi:hypothetical protein
MKKVLLLYILLLFSMDFFAANKVWIGSNSSNWNTAGNWSGGIPSNGDNVIIDPSNYNAGVAPVINSASVFSPANITIQNAGSFTINAALTISGNISVASTSTLTTTNPSDGVVYFNGTTTLLGTGTFIFPNIVINSGKTLEQREATLINVKGSWTNNGGSFIPNLNKVIFTGTIVQQINGTSTTQTFYDFEIDKNSQSLRIGGSLTTLNVHDFTQTSFKFHDSALSVFNVSGNFLHTSGTFVPCNNIAISGNITDNHPYGGLTWGKMVTLNGSNGQVIGGAYSMSFNKLIINNSSVAGITLQKPTSIDSSLTLYNGIVHTDAINLLIIKKNASSTSGSAISFVDGPIKKIGATPFVFPVGNAGVWARLEMVDDANFKNFSTTTEFTCTYYKTAAPNNTQEFMSADINHVSRVEYWNLERTYDTGNDAKCNVRLYWEDTSRSGISNLADLKVAHFSTVFNFYENRGASISACGKTGTITTTIPLTSFSPFTFGSGSGLNPLPIELLSFEAKIITGNKVALKWNVASEMNNALFIVERSADGIHYEEIAKIKGAGTSHYQQSYSTTDESPYTDTSYYRLKQIDYDGKSKCHKSVYVILGGHKTELLIYPNPLCFGEPLLLKTNTNSDKTIQLLIIDNTGKTICVKNVALKKGVNLVQGIENDCSLPKGTYSIAVIHEETCAHFKIIVQ